MKQPKHKRTAAQVAAGRAFAAAGRKAQAAARASATRRGIKPAVSKAKRQAELRFAAAGRAAQARKRAGLKPLPKKKPALAGGAGIHELPVCAAVSIAEHLAAAARVLASDEEILALWRKTEGGTLAEVIEAAADAFEGAPLRRFWRCDEDEFAPGLIYGVSLDVGYHAVLSWPSGLLSWGMVMPCLGRPDEAWQLEWDVPF